MASKTVYIFFWSEESCLRFADSHADRILHMGYRTFDPATDNLQGISEANDCTNKGDWFVRIQLDSNYNMLGDESVTVADSSSLKPASNRKRRSGV